MSEKKFSEKQIERNKKIAEDGKPYHFTSESARELQKKSAEAKHRNAERRKSLQEIAKWLGNLSVNNKNLLDPDKIIDFESSKAINMTVNEALVLSQLHKALDGDTQAAIFIRDIIGEKPKEEIEVHGMTIDEYAKNHKPKF